MPVDPIEQQLARLQAENRALASQVKRLVQTEQDLYTIQERLDQQIKLYKTLYEVGRVMNSARNVEALLVATVAFVIYELNFQRCVILLPEPDGSLCVRGMDGYYEDELAARVAAVRLSHDALAALPPLDQANIAIYIGEPDPALRELGNRFAMDRFLVQFVPRGGEERYGVLVAGNALDKDEYHVDITPDSPALVGMSNLIGQLSVAIDNIELYRTLDEERQLLEVKVGERTRDLQKAMSDLEALDKLKSQFFANVSHELRTPLTLSAGPLELILRDTTMPEAVTRPLRVVYTNILRLTKLITDLLDFARVEAGGLQGTFRAQDVTELIRFYAGTLEAAAFARGMELVVNPGSEPIELYLDRDKFERVFMNLLSNAFKFTPDGGRIEVFTTVAPDSVRIHVRDSGIGIPEQARQHIFERFSQVDGSDTRQYEGTGIGLALARELMVLHGGEIQVDSELGRGSTFTLVFPRGSDHLVAERIIDADPDDIVLATQPDSTAGRSQYTRAVVDVTAHQGGVRSPPGRPSLLDRLAGARTGDRPLILVVDDNDGMRGYIAALLDSEYDIITAPDGKDAWDKAQAHVPDLVISDVQMPRMSGHELYNAIKAAPAPLGHTPVILLTARADIQSKIASLEQGADDYITKPFNAAELRARVGNLLTARRQEKELEKSLARIEAQSREQARDLEQARRFQQSVLAPPPVDERLAFAVLYRPASYVGGDYYDIARLDDWRYRIFLADIAGHGVQAGLRTMLLEGAYEAVRSAAVSPADVLARLNHVFSTMYADLSILMTACCIDIVLADDAAKGQLIYALAGSPPLIHTSPDGGTTSLETPNAFLGALDRLAFVEERCPLHRGDRLFCYTDGLYEQWTTRRRLVSADEVLAALIAPHVGLDEVVHGTVLKVDELMGGDRPVDDITLIGIELSSDAQDSASP